MATGLVDIANNAGGKIGGFGDALNGEALTTAALLTADDDKINQWINIKYPTVRQKVIADFAAMQSPFKETLKYADLNDDLKQDDIAISTITSVSTVVTVTTAKVHNRTTGVTVFLADIIGDVLFSLNGTTPTITVIDTTSFTLDDVVGVDATWDHDEDTGIVSYVPEMGPWNYAFTLPTDYHALVRQTDEVPTVNEGVRKKYRCAVILNKDNSGLLLLTNSLTNLGGDGAYIEYCIDQTTFTLFSPAFEEVIATLLAAELCPILGRDLETRQQILIEYKAITVPEAKAYNQSQGNTSAKTVGDFSGGRSGRRLITRRGSRLGTYTDSQGNRRSV